MKKKKLKILYEVCYLVMCIGFIIFVSYSMPAIYDYYGVKGQVILTVILIISLISAGGFFTLFDKVYN